MRCTPGIVRAFAGLLLLLAAGASGETAQESPRGVTSAGNGQVTFARDVAPVLYEHCVPCHRNGGSAPFSLLTYDQARPWARAIALAVRRGVMPPWKPLPGRGGPFVGERRLRDDEVARLERW